MNRPHHSSAAFSWGLALLCLSVQILLVTAEGKGQWAWIDESCHDKMNVIENAFEEYLELAEVAHSSLGDGITDIGRATLRTFFGNVDPTGLHIQSKYNTLRNIGREEKVIPYSLYCDGSAFEWIDTDCNGSSIEGQWWATRSNPDGPELYIKDEKTNDICEDAQGNKGNAVSQPHGHAIILCPLAFEKRTTIGSLKDQAQPPGTSIDKMVSVGSILLHELTHVVLGTRDIRYDAIPCIFLAFTSAVQARKNADTYELYALCKSY